MIKGYGVRPQKGSETAWECYDVWTGTAVLSNVSNQEAWLEVDRRQNEAVSKSQSTADWLWRERLNK